MYFSLFSQRGIHTYGIQRLFKINSRICGQHRPNSESPTTLLTTTNAKATPTTDKIARTHTVWMSSDFGTGICLPCICQWQYTWNWWLCALSNVNLCGENLAGWPRVCSERNGTERLGYFHQPKCFLVSRSRTVQRQLHDYHVVVLMNWSRWTKHIYYRLVPTGNFDVCMQRTNDFARQWAYYRSVRLWFSNH